MPVITLVCGPPGSGKTRYVEEHRKDGDLIVDYDAIFAALTGLPWYRKPRECVPFVCEARDAVINRLHRPTDLARAWVITGEPNPLKRRLLRAKLGATVVELNVPADVCLARIASDPRRIGSDVDWRTLVDQWQRD